MSRLQWWRRWWAVCGSDPVWWLLLPLLLIFMVLFGPFWLAAWAIRKMEDWPDWLDWVGEAPVRWMQSKYWQRRARRVSAWNASERDQ